MRRSSWPLQLGLLLHGQPAQASDSGLAADFPESTATPEPNGGLHLAYGVGGSLTPGSHPPTFRHHLEGAVVAGQGYDEGCSGGGGVVGCWSPIRGLLFGASGLWGLGASASYLLLDAGYGSTNVLAAFAGCFEFGARLGTAPKPVAGARASVDLMFVNLGARAAVSLEHQPEVVLWITVGLGQY